MHVCMYVCMYIYNVSIVIIADACKFSPDSTEISFSQAYHSRRDRQARERFLCSVLVTVK